MFLVLLTVVGSASWACSISVPAPHVVDPSQVGVDTRAPGKPSIVDWEIGRGYGGVVFDSPPGECNLGYSSCDDLGWMKFSVEGYWEDEDSVDGLALEFEVVDGASPDGFVFPAAAASRIFHWIDGSGWEQEPFEFAVVVRAVDAAGNWSSSSDVVWVSDPGHEDIDPCEEVLAEYRRCSAVSPLGTMSVSMFLMLVVSTRRR